MAAPSSPPDPRLGAAVAAVDRELAANLELMSAYDQTRQAVVLENGEFLRARGVLAGLLDEASYRHVARLYEEIPTAETAMERRGPAGTVKDADRLVVEAWEGDAREAQRLLRAALLPPVVSAAEHAPDRGPLARLRALLRRVLRP